MNKERWPPRLGLHTSVLELLTGDRFYSSADAALREAILNALDACQRRESAEADSTPRIEVLFDERTNCVAVGDNGDGMGQEQVSNLFSLIGASISRLTQPEGGQIGEFGIGVASYFLACERFELHTKRSDEDAVGLTFHKGMLDGTTDSIEIPARQSEQGTTVYLYCRNEDLFQLLLQRFPYWIREVPSIDARLLPSGNPIPQGPLKTIPKPISLEMPDWAEKISIGPPRELPGWSSLDGKAHVDILYRGVFVQEYEEAALWGIEGAIHVDPRHFKPRLNREGFLAEGFRDKINTLLTRAHPTILMDAVESFRSARSEQNLGGWTLRKWIRIWLSIPKSPDYTAAREAWDAEFRHLPAFRLLKQSGEDSRISINELSHLQTTGTSELFVAPHNLQNTNQLVKNAVNILRAKGQIVVQGLEPDKTYLSQATTLFPSTAELLDRFASDLPKKVQATDVAKEILEQEDGHGPLFPGEERIKLISLGSSSDPIVIVGDEIWINPNSIAGRNILLEVCNRNRGIEDVLFATFSHAPQLLPAVTNQLKKIQKTDLRLGPVRRQHYRNLTH